ncbi:hypothetical protein D3C76_839820 [compost metagenome]
MEGRRKVSGGLFVWTRLEHPKELLLCVYEGLSLTIIDYILNCVIIQTYVVNITTLIRNITMNDPGIIRRRVVIQIRCNKC